MSTLGDAGRFGLRLGWRFVALGWGERGGAADMVGIGRPMGGSTGGLRSGVELRAESMSGPCAGSDWEVGDLRGPCWDR